MTREEAIKLLQAARMMLLGEDNQPVSDLYDALDMAISALEQQQKDEDIAAEAIENALKIKEPCDTISREDVYELAQELAYTTSDKTDYITNLFDGLSKLPTVQPSEDDIHREREQSYMQGYEDASKRFRQEPCEDAISDIMGISKSRTHDIMENELRCVQRASCGGCDRECGECPLMMDDKEIIKAYGYVIRMLELPSVQPIHRDRTVQDFADKCRECGKMRKGHWIVGSDTDIKGETVYWFTCSECKSDRGQHTNYCPDCGAKMDNTCEVINDSTDIDKQ